MVNGFGITRVVNAANGVKGRTDSPWGKGGRGVGWYEVEWGKVNSLQEAFIKKYVAYSIISS